MNIMSSCSACLTLNSFKPMLIITLNLMDGKITLSLSLNVSLLLSFSHINIPCYHQCTADIWILHPDNFITQRNTQRGVMFPLNQCVQTLHQLITPERENFPLRSFWEISWCSVWSELNPVDWYKPGNHRLREGTLLQGTLNSTFCQRREHTVIHQPPKHTHSQTLQRFASKLYL